MSEQTQPTKMVLGRVGDRYVLSVSNLRVQSEIVETLARLRAATGVRREGTGDLRYVVSMDASSAARLELDPEWSWTIPPTWGDTLAWCADRYFAQQSAHVADDDGRTVEADDGGAHRIRRGGS